MQGEQLMDLDGYEKGYAHGWRDGRAETPDRPEPIDEERLARATATAWRALWIESASAGWHTQVWLDEDVIRQFENGEVAAAIAAAYRTEPGETND